MYQSLLPILKPLIFEGKGGILEVTHKYNDTARIYLKEGIIEQVETKNMHGRKAALTCIQWISITTSFKENEQGNYLADPEIDTMSILSFLEKTFKNIPIINDNIPNDTIACQVDSHKLQKSDKLNANDLKIALLLDGQTSIGSIVSIASHPELTVLTRICRLLLDGVAEKVIIKDVMPSREREDFLDALEEKITDMVGPAGGFLIDNGFGEIGSSRDKLTREEIGQLVSSIGESLEDNEKAELEEWGTKYS